MFELTLLVPADAVEPVCDALCDALGAASVSVEDADAGSPHEQALFGEPDMPAPAAGWQRSTLKALFATEVQATQAAAWCLARESAFASTRVLGIEPVPEADWVRLTQSQFAPVPVSPDFWIVPSWHEPPAQARVVIRLDPGLAFGTGTHPTTRMCLRWIAAHLCRDARARVLDYGCGSGILAIAAALHGAAAVHAVDIDPDAVRATVDNARANAVVVTAGGAGSTTGPYDIVLANILATPLKLLAPLLTREVAVGGHLVLAGLLLEQAKDIAATYAPGVPLEVIDQEDGWALLSGRRR